MGRVTALGSVACLCSILAATAAQAEPIMPLSEVRPGMRGHGMTVLRGTTPERFDVEVIDVLHQFLPRQDLILIRMDHPIINHSGTVGGMSGSPIYINGRLIGALAYGWLYAMDPIAGVTPIETMLGELNRPLRNPVLAGPLPGGLAAAPVAAEASVPASIASVFGPPTAFWERFRDTLGPTPAMTPLMLGGFSARVRDLLGQLLGDYGMVPVEAGGGGGTGPLPRAGQNAFVPGSAIGVQLIRGDLAATSIGTVTTLRDPNRVLAFGHPMFDLGETRYPVATARILTVLASRRRSFKIGEPQAEAGALVQDRQPCIIADTSSTGPMTPVQIDLADTTTSRTDRYQVEVVRDRFLFPVLALSAVESAIERFASDRDDLTATVRGTIHMAGRPSLTLTDHLFTELGTSNMNALLGTRPLRALRPIVRNDFEAATIDRLEVSISLGFRREAAEIIGAYVTTAEPEAGSRTSVHVVIRPFGGPEEVRIIPLQIPRDAAGQQVQIEVTGGDDSSPPVPTPNSLDDVLSNMRRTFPATALVVTMSRRAQGVAVRGHVAEHLPPSALDALRPAAQDAGEQPLRTALQVQAPYGRVLTGRARIRLSVRAPGA